MQKNKSAGGGRGGRGGGYGGGGGHREQQRDYDAPSYGQHQPSNHAAAPQGGPPGAQPPVGAAGAADPYAACESWSSPFHTSLQRANDSTDGGYQAYLAMWYQAIAAQQAQGGAPGGPQPPPGTS